MSISRTVLITGAGMRIGAALATSLAQDGWNIAIHYNRSAKEAKALAQTLKVKTYLVQADLQDEKQVATLFPQLKAQNAPIDALINNAAVFEKDDVQGFDEVRWHEHMQVNLYAPIRLARDFAAQYHGTRGNVINITDGIVGWSISPNFLSYSLSKLGLNDATQLLAQALAPNIRVNAVAPGPTLEGKQDNEDTFEKLRQRIPLLRVSNVEEVCKTVRYVLNADSVTGQVISLAGGMELKK